MKIGVLFSLWVATYGQEDVEYPVEYDSQFEVLIDCVEMLCVSEYIACSFSTSCFSSLEAFLYSDEYSEEVRLAIQELEKDPAGQKLSKCTFCSCELEVEAAISQQAIAAFSQEARDIQTCPSVPNEDNCFGPGVTSITSWAQLRSVCGRFASQSIPESIGQLVDLEVLHLRTEAPNPSTLPSQIGLLSSLTSLALAQFELTSIPESFGNLTELRELSLHSCGLTSLPISIGQLSNLAQLNVTSNLIQSLPESIGFLSMLTSLNLDENKLQSLPDSIGLLAGLTWVSMAGNEIKSLPVSTGNLRLLSFLSLSNNQLETLPASMGDLSLLTSLLLDGNQLQALPETIGQLSRLALLNLAKNQLKELPESIGQLQMLPVLDLTSNDIEFLPSSIGSLSKLTALELLANNVQSLPEEMAQLTELKSLSLRSNRLQALPTSIGLLSNLEMLYIGNNQLLSLPESIGKMASLKGLFAGNNHLLSLPDSVGTLSNLTGLHLQDNFLRSLPESIGLLLNLEGLHLLNNELQSLPESIGKLSKLEWLHLQNNQLQSLSDSISMLSKLTILHLGNNNLQTIPESFGMLSLLKGLSLNSNALQALPEEIGRLAQLSGLDLASNFLTALPASIGQLTSLSRLALANNQLLSLPESIGHLTHLQDLTVRRNQLQTLPNSIGSLQHLIGLDLNSNLLQVFPDSIGDLSQLKSIDLGNNNLQTVPESIKRMSQLTSLLLQSNQLQHVPDFIGEQLVSLRTLDLESNYLDGLPDSIGQLSQLTELQLRSNLFHAVPGPIQDLAQLNKLGFAHNMLHNLPSFMVQLSNLAELDLSANQFDLRALSSLTELPNLAKLGLQSSFLDSLPDWFARFRTLKQLDLGLNNFTSPPEQLHNISSLLTARLHGNNFTTLALDWAPTFTVTLRDNPFICDRDSLGWIENFDLRNLEDLNEVRCGAVNEFGGMVVGRLRFASTEPNTHPVLNSALSTARSSSEVQIGWTYSGEIGDALDDVTNINQANIKAFGIENEFNCTLSTSFLETFSYSILLAFQVEWRISGDADAPWNKLCTLRTTARIGNLQPNTIYDVRVVALHVRSANPKVSEGPRSMMTRIATLPSLPGDPPQHLSIVSSSIRETSLTLEWQPPTQPNSDQITYTVSMNNETIAESLPLPTFMVVGLDAGSHHVFRVRAESQVGPGSWSDPVEAITQHKCELGYQRVDDAAYSCLKCPLDTYRDDVNANDCFKCPVDRPHTLATGATSESNCTDGKLFLQLDQEKSEGGRTIMPGFWRISELTLAFHACRVPEFCEPPKPQLASEWKGPDQYCTEHHTGVMCMECKGEDYVMRRSGCEHCDSPEKSRDRARLAGWSAFGTVLMVSPAAVILAKTFAPKTGPDQSCSSICPTRLGCSPPEDLVKDVAVAVRICLGFFQVFLQFGWLTNVLEPSEGGLEFVAFLNPTALLKLFDVGCAWVATFYDGLLLYTLFPLVTVTLMFVVLFGVTKPCSKKERFASLFGLALWTTLQLLFVVYPGVSSTIFRTFDSTEYYWVGESGPALEVLTADVSIEFNSLESHRWRFYAYAMIAVYPVGVVCFFGIMVRLGLKLATQKTQSEVGKSVEFLSAPYTWAYFECYELVRKLALTSVFLLIQKETATGALIFFLASCILFHSFLVSLQPYKSLLLGRFAILSSALLLAVGFLPISVEMRLTGREMANHLAVTVAVLELVGLVLFLGIQLYLSVTKGRRISWSWQRYSTSNNNNNNQSFGCDADDAGGAVTPQLSETSETENTTAIQNV